MKYKPQWQIDEEHLHEYLEEERKFIEWQRRQLIADEQTLNHKADFIFSEKYNRWVAIK